MEFKPFCCYDGLFLILDLSDKLFGHLLLWNPSTRESIELPRPEPLLEYYVYGLGYDETSDDYKILAVDLSAFYDLYANVSVEILSLKSGSWRRIGEKHPTGVHRVRGFRDCGMDYLPFVHGAFHWLGMSEYCSDVYRTIVSFNISNEVYGVIPLSERMCNIPHLLNIDPHVVIRDHGVSVLGGMLCFYSTYNACHGRTFKLWAMKDYGV
ncbi:F-box protein CPR1-like [Lycium ferocissimum]|uniref:F-box protein CPR1-like n=1 Tax=Lycium ferocissimum TaxID=112874 RepID=UPI0028163FD0|nr:F-box protein CPR1-like [Lycium ferocissimum]